MNEEKKATPRKELMRELLDSNEPKTAREHAAVRAIEELLEALERIKASGVFLGVIPQQMMEDAIAKARGEA